MKVGHVPLVPYFRPGDIRVADYIATLIDTYRARDLSLRAVMCDRLGPQVWGSNLVSTMAVLEELEETARLWLRSGRQAEPLSEAAIEECRQYFKAAW
jgi:ribulose-5-phosphate 4-epimerase/fuculose-1-phosphate aldolase